MFLVGAVRGPDYSGGRLSRRNHAISRSAAMATPLPMPVTMQISTKKRRGPCPIHLYNILMFANTPRGSRFMRDAGNF